MPMRKLKLVPDSAGYGAVLRDGVTAIELEGGSSWMGLDVIGMTKRVSVQWTLDPSEYTYLTSFHRLVTQWHVEPFLIDLIVGDAALKEHQAQFMPGSFRLIGQEGMAYFVAAELEVMPHEDESEEYDEAIVYVIDELGDSFLWAEDKLDQLINLKLPETTS